MVKITVRCFKHGHPVAFYVREGSAFLGFSCSECETHVHLDVVPDAPEPVPPAPTQEKGA